MSRVDAITVSLRVLIAGLAGAIAGIHLDLWGEHGYRHIPTIGALFLLNGIAGAVLGLASLIVPGRLVPGAWLAIAGFGISTLVALLISLTGTLFGFTETTDAPLIALSIGVEAAAAVAGIAAVLWKTFFGDNAHGRVRRKDG